MSQQEKKKEDMIKDIDGYLMQLVYLKDLLSVEDDIRNNEEKMKCAPNFTLIIESALIDSYILILARLYDKFGKAKNASEETKNKPKKPKTIPNLIQECKSYIHLFPSMDNTLLKLEEFEKGLAERKKTIETLRKVRNSIHAHNDPQYFGEKLQNSKLKLKTYQIWDLACFSEEVLNYLFSQLSSEEIRKTKYDKDLKKLLELSQEVDV